MAFVIAPFQLRGKLGGLSFFENEFGQQVKQNDGPTEWHIQHQDSYKNALRNADEFARATAAAKLLREAMGDLRKGVRSMRLNGRMNGPMLQAIKADMAHGWGDRMISYGDLSVLAGFEFNHNLSLDDALPLNVENCYTVEADKIVLQLPAFRLRKKEVLPKKATHYRLVSAVITVDFDKRRYQQDVQTTPLQAMGRKAGAAFSAEHVLSASTPGSFWMLGIEFYTMEKDGPALIKGGALRVMQWIGTARKDEVVVEAVPEMAEKETVQEMGVVAQEGVAEKVGVKKETAVQEQKAVAPLATTTPTPAPVVKVNYMSSGQQSSNVIYQVGQQGWYGTSSR
jgi:hypothetical protein